MCDFTIASTRSTFGQTGPRVGSPASGWGVGYLAQIVGQKKAREIWMVTQQYSAQQALEMGLANSVVPHEQLRDEVIRYCNLLKNNSPIILELQKITFNEVTQYMEEIAAPTQRYFPDYEESEEAEERRHGLPGAETHRSREEHAVPARDAQGEVGGRWLGPRRRGKRQGGSAAHRIITEVTIDGIRIRD